MKRTLYIGLVTFAIIFAIGVQANAQAPKRIQFGKGKSSATVSGTVGEGGVTYVIRARSGQKLILDLTPAKNVGIKVETVGRFGEMVLLRETNGGYFEIGLEQTGDYTIFIGPLGRNPITYSLTVKIGKLTDT